MTEINRRQVLKATLATFCSMQFSQASYGMNESFYMPDESAPHLRTWMAFVANPRIWSQKQVPRVKSDLALLAHTVAQFEPVNMLVASWDIEAAEKHFKKLGSTRFPISLVEFAVDDLWLRDTGPIFVRNQNGKKLAIDFNFNGWGNKQTHSRDKKVASFIAKYAGVETITSNIVMEGGSIEVDGFGTAMMTLSSIVNDNRNPGISIQEIESELAYLLGIKKFIWLDGVAGKDITDGHIDFYARFVDQSHVVVARENYKATYDYVVTRKNIAKLGKSLDANGNALGLSIIDAPDQINESYGTGDFAAGYIGYYVCNGAVIMQAFGDRKRDANAKKILEEVYPDREVVAIAIDGIASGGGTIHCATQQEIYMIVLYSQTRILFE